MMFKKSSQSRMYQDVMEQIQTAILEGKLKPGDKLPPQREMADTFQVSTPTLREALRVLEQKGLVEMRLGISGGTIVKEANTEQVGESLALLIKHRKVPVTQLAEFREFADGYVAALAAERAEPSDIDTLNRHLAEAEKHLEKGISHLQDFDRADRNVHVTIAHISRNMIFISIVEMIHQHLDLYYQSLPKENEQIMRHNYEDLCDIVSAIAKGQATEAQSAARTHVRRYFKFVRNEQEKANPGNTLIPQK